MKAVLLFPGVMVSGRLSVIFGTLVFLTAPDLKAAVPLTTLNIVNAGTDSEGWQTFQLDWNAVADATYRVQVSTDLALWRTMDVVTPASALGSYRVPPSIVGVVNDKSLFARLVLPEPEITGVEPAVVDVTVPNTTLYILGQCLPSSNVTVVINGISFTPTIINSDGVWATVLLNGLPPGEPWLNVSVVEQGTGTVIATLPNSFLAVDSDSPYLLEPPELPPAAPVATEQYKLQSGFIYATQPPPAQSIGGGGNVGINEPLPYAGLAASRNIAAVMNGNVLISESRRAPAAVARASGLEVMPFSGEARQQVVDLAVEGRGLDFVWARTYRSRTSQSSSLGTRWAHSYDIHLQPQGGDIVIHDGTASADRFYLQSNGTYTSPGFFREGTLTSGVFKLTFADTGYWEFNALGASAASGKLAKIVDRNGNTILLNYDGTGRLFEIVDTLSRSYIIGYDTAGRLATVADFSGRTMTYQYYSGLPSDPGGSAGDLKSVTSPAVTGTPNGNDFPLGKTTTYTYSTGHLDDRKNHLLLSVIDAQGVTVREYIHQYNESDWDFLRCTSVKRWTDTATRFTYLPQTPSAANQFATLRCIVNDPVGNVMDCFYDARNRRVKMRQFTGRAAPGDQVTDTATLPIAKLRASDPAFYECRAEWNNDSLCSRLYLFGGQQLECVYESDFDKTTPARKRADLRVLREIASAPVDLDGDGVADVTERASRFEYAQQFGTSERCSRVKIQFHWDRHGKDDDAALKEYSPALQYLVGDTVVYNQSIYLSVADTTGTFNPLKWQTIAALGKGIQTLPSRGQLYQSSDSVGVTFGTGLGKTDVTDVELRCSFPTSATDPRGNVTTSTHDATGNLTRLTAPFTVGNDPPVVDFTHNTHGQLTSITHAEDAIGRRRVDSFDYYTSGAQSGFIRIRDIDSAPVDGFHITTTYEYDARGNATRVIDPRGHDWLHTFNALDQCVRVRTPVNITARCATDFFYDANDNLVQCATEVRDAADALLGSKVDTCIVDPLHRVTRIDRAVDAGISLANEFVYDGNDQCVLVRGGAAVSGADLFQKVAFQFDERRLLYRRVRAGGSTAQSTDQFDYTAGLRLGVANGGIERPGFGHAFVYDGFDRPVIEQDPMGNQTVSSFDLCGNLKRVRRLGQFNDVPGSTGNVRLAESRYEYNQVNLRIRARDLFFVPATQALIGDGERTTQFAFAPCGQCTSMTDDLGRTTMFGYDTAWRHVSVASAGGKTVMACFKDAAGNVSSITRTDQPDLGGPPQVFTRTNVHDSRNRCTSTSDNVGNTSTCFFDSLNRAAKTTDPRGVSTFYTHDLLGRQTQSVLDLDGSGAPGANDLTHTAYWVDSDPRWPGVYTDSHGNSTSRGVDSLGRCTSITRADGTHHTFVWDARDELPSEVDANGTVSAHSYDLNGRRTATAFTFAPGSSVATTTTFEQFGHDGLSRLVSAQNDVSSSTFDYDSHGNLRGNHTDGWNLLCAFDSENNRTSVTYPGGRVLTFNHDVIDRCTSIVEGGAPLASYLYAGPGRVARIDYANGNRAVFNYNGRVGVPNASGDFGWGDVSGIHHAAAGGSPLVVDFVCLRDRAGNTTARAVTTPAPTLHTDTTALTYDNANWLTDSVVTSSSAVVNFASYVLDRMGNRTSINRPFCAGAYTMNALVPGPMDFQMNQYTSTPCDTRGYDDNGNLTTIGAGALSVASHVFDCHDRLVTVTNNGALAASYAYNALGQRVSKTIFSSTLPPVTTTFRFDGGSVIEESAFGVVGKSFVLDGSRSSDDGVIMRFDWQQVRGPIAMRAGGHDYFLHKDDLGNCFALTDESGAVVERYLHDDYGAVTFLTSDGTPTGTSSSSVGNVYCWGGMRLDAETGLQNNDGGGYLDTQSGRYIMRAGIPLRTDPALGYAANNPWSGGGSSARSKQSESKSNSKAMFTAEKARMVGGGGAFVGTMNSAGEPANDTNDVNRFCITRPILKSFFETGDKPTQSQFATFIDSMVNFVDDRDFIGLRIFSKTGNVNLSPTTGDLEIIIK